MKTVNMEKLLKQYKIDVEFIEEFLDNDPVEVEETFFRRKEILENFENLTINQLKQFLIIEKELSKALPKIKKKYPLLYEKIIEPTDEELKNKLINILVSA